MCERRSKCSELKENDAVVFNLFSDIFKRKTPMNGNVVFVDFLRRVVSIIYLDGYRSEYADIPFEDMLAVHDENGERMQFENISGKSLLLVAE